jgi:hypothetical protein
MRAETRSGIGDEAIPDAANGLDGRSVRPELPAQLRDVDIDGPRLTGEIGAPDVLQERLATEDDSGVSGQGGQEVELAGAQLHDPLPHRRLAQAQSNGKDVTVAQGHLDAMTAAVSKARTEVAGDADAILAQTPAAWNAGTAKPVLDAARASISAARSDLRTAVTEARAVLAALR